MKNCLWVMGTMLAGALLLPQLALADHHDHEGWYLEVEGASVTPGNVNTPLIASDPNFNALGGSLHASADVLYSDINSSPAYAVGLGYSWGKMGRLEITWWNYSVDESATVSANNPGQYNWFTIGPTASVGASYEYPVNLDLNHEIKAWTVDLEYKRTLNNKSENLHVSWGVGLRYAKFDEDVLGLYHVGPSTVDSTFPVARSVEGDGFGFTGSVEVEYDFPNTFVGLSTDLRLGFINADVDSSHLIVDLDGYSADPGASWSESSRMGDEVAQTIDFDANVVFHAGKRVDVDLGWFYKTWSDLPTVNLARAANATFNSGPQLIGENRERISFSGPRLKVRFRF